MRPFALLRPTFLAVTFLVASCARTPTGTINVVTGEEADTLTRAPAPTTLVVEQVAPDATTKLLAKASLPVGELSLGNAPSSAVGAVRVTGLGADGKALVVGETLFVQFGALEGSALEIFIQRTGELARFPRSPATSFDAPLVDVVAGRYILAASGTASLLYDLLRNLPLSFAPPLPRVARSVATYGTTALVIDEGQASLLDLSGGTAVNLAAPVGGTFAEISGGRTVNAPDGSEYIIGGTRQTGGPSARVLKIDPNGVVSFVSLSAPREGACATWVEGRGVVIVGGSGSAPGAEVLAPTATSAAPLPLAPDPIHGCGAAPLDSGHVVVAGGTGGVGDAGAGLPARVLDLGCGSNCTPTVWQGALAFSHAQVISLRADAALIGGDDPSGAFKVVRASPSGTRDVPLRVPRRSARLLALPNGATAIVGGAPQIESYRD